MSVWCLPLFMSLSGFRTVLCCTPSHSPAHSFLDLVMWSFLLSHQGGLFRANGIRNLRRHCFLGRFSLELERRHSLEALPSWKPHFTPSISFKTGNVIYYGRFYSEKRCFQFLRDLPPEGVQRHEERYWGGALFSLSVSTFFGALENAFSGVFGCSHFFSRKPALSIKKEAHLVIWRYV